MPRSYHIFYFPFIVRHGGEEDAIVKAINATDFGYLWERSEQSGEKRLMELSDEKIYYHHFVHNALYDNGNNLLYNDSQGKNKSDNNYSLVLHCERKDIKSNCRTFRIKIDGKERYILDVDKITLDYYFTNVGILSLYISNVKYLSPQNILDINYYGRILYDLGFDGVLDFSICNSQYTDMPRKKNRNCCGAVKKNMLEHIKQLLDDFFKEIGFDASVLEYLPVFDNKMYVNCCYLNDDLGNLYKEDTIRDLSNEIFWQNFVEVDAGSDFGCQNQEMRELLTRQNSYLRWQNYGTLYGITDRSFVCLCADSSFSQNVLLRNMRSVYSQMVKLVLIQRASLLAFSDSVSRANFNADDADTADVIGKIYKNYIIYIKKIYFKDITSQVQGVELYKMLHDTFDINKHIEGFDNELSKINVYLSALKDSDKRDRQNNLFNLLAGLFLPATLVTSVLGMNDMLEKNKEIIQVLEVPISKYIISDLMIVIFISLVFWVLMCFNKTVRSIVYKNKITVIIIALAAIMTLFYLGNLK